MAMTMDKTGAAMDTFMAALKKTAAKPVAQGKSKLPTVDIGELMGGGNPKEEPFQPENESVEAVDVSLKNGEMPTASFLQQTSLEAKGRSTQRNVAAADSKITTEKHISTHPSAPSKPSSPSKPLTQPSGEDSADRGIADLIARAMQAKKAIKESAELTLRARAKTGSELAEMFGGAAPGSGAVSGRADISSSGGGLTFASAFSDRLQPTPLPQSIKVAAYIRVSTDSSDQENSYETQERYFSQLLAGNPSWVSAGVYSDYGISGTSKEKRTGFKRLLRHCAEGRIDRIFCKSISRFARNTEDFRLALRTLKENNVTIFFERENLDTADSVNDFILTTLGAIAQEESRSISSNLRWGMQKRFPKGEVKNIPVYGYRYSGEMLTMESGYRYKGIEIVEEEAEVVRRIFREVAEGRPYVEIARGLNYDHIPEPSPQSTVTIRKKGRKGILREEIKEGWTGPMVSQIVQRERYVGDVLMQKTYTVDHLTHKVRQNNGEMEQFLIRDHHPAIVDRETYEAAQKVVEMNRALHGGRGGKKKLYPFSKLLICADCGRFYTVYNAKNNPIWVCPSVARCNGKVICRSEKVYEEQIVRMFRKAVIERFRLTAAPVIDNVAVADIMSGRFADSAEIFSLEADGFVAQMQGRLESIQRHDNMERDRAFLKRQIAAAQIGIDRSGKRVRLLKSQRDAMETRLNLLNDESITDAMVAEKAAALREEEARLAGSEAEMKDLESRLAYLERYWDELEEGFEYREDAINWLETLPKGRDGTVEFMNGLTSDYVKAFVLSVTIHSPLKYTVHWFDDTKTEVELYSNIEDYRYTSSWIRKHS